MESLAYLEELHQDQPKDENKKGIKDGFDRFVYVGPRTNEGTFPLTYMRRVSELSKLADEVAIPKADIFYSLNSFWKPSRKTEDVRHLRALYVDIDCYSVERTPMDVLAELEEQYIGERIPEPNAITFTGRGLNCIWFIENAPKQALQTWRRVGAYLLNTLKDLGADPKCSTDASRVFRLPGSINPKSGEQVKLKLRHENKYALRDLHAIYTPWEETSKKKVVHYKRKSYANAVKRNKFTWSSLNIARLQDLKTLQSLRNKEKIEEGYRETALMWFHYFSACMTGGKDAAEELTIEFNENFNRSIPKAKLRGIMDYSFKHGTNWAEAFANHQLYKVKPKTSIYGMGLLASNKTLIEMLDIKAEEQQMMCTIIGEDEYKRRERIRSANNRRKNGQMTREQYNAQQAQKKQSSLDCLRTLLNEQPNMKKTQIARELGIGRTYLYKLLEQI